MTDTHTEALVERVAKAISVPQHHTTWDMLSEQEKDLFYMQAEYAIAAIEALPARNDERALKLVEALRGVREFLMSAPMESGVCCCGSPVDGHGFGDGHSPVDELSYAAQGQIERIDTALADTQPSGETRS